MPSQSPAQHRLMEAAAHSKNGVGGVSRKVGAEFVKADDEAPIDEGDEIRYERYEYTGGELNVMQVGTEPAPDPSELPEEIEDEDLPEITHTMHFFPDDE